MNRNDARFGSLPSYAPLAAAYVPMQEDASDSYEAFEALSRGTLFPGLDLPFRNVVNETLPPSPLTEMMAIDFVADELELYLDTHSDDPDVNNVMRCLREREIVHYQRCGEALRLAMEKMDQKNLYAVNPAFDR